MSIERIRKSWLLSNASLLVIGGAIAGVSPALAQDDDGLFMIEEIIVTATKRAVSMQSVPQSIQAISAEALENAGVSSFEDYVAMVPTLSYISYGPGQTMMYMRGVSDGGDNNPAGSQPTAALYLDDLSLSFIGRNMDLHIYDMQRIEVLNGPQGTLYGASSLSGTVRLISNKPDPNEWSAGVDVELSKTQHGDMSHLFEGFINIPLVEDKAAIRLVGWVEDEGGFIDNIAGSREWTFNDDIYDFAPWGEYDGTYYGYDLNTVTLDAARTTNEDWVEDDYNDAKSFGFRGSLLVNLNESWTVTVSGIYQDVDTEGAWDYDPDHGDLNVVRFGPEESSEKVKQIGMTIEGDLGIADIVYAGSYMTRDFSFVGDYTEYLDAYYNWFLYTGDYVEDNYYNFAGYSPDTDYAEANLNYMEDTTFKRWTHEVRIQSNDDSKFQWLVGGYYENYKHNYDYYYEFPNMNAMWVGPGGNQDEWWSSTNVRTDKQIAGFGEISYQFTDKLTATAGARFFNVKYGITLDNGYLHGGNAAFWGGYFQGWAPRGEESDQTFKFNLKYEPNDDLLLYATFSQGFRTGGVNRDPNLTAVPQTYLSDGVDNYELGWKMTAAEGRLRLNGAVYRMEWSDFQNSMFIYAESPVGFNVNAGNAVIKGAEIDMTAMILENLVFTGGLSINDANLISDFNRFDTGATLASEGNRLPFVPKFKASASLRYEKQMENGMLGFAQASFTHTGDSTSSLKDGFNIQAAYNITNIRIGVDNEKWGIEAFIDNATDERAEIFYNTLYWDNRISTNRPRTFGIRVKARFN